MKKNYIEPSMMVVTLNTNTILAGSDPASPIVNDKDAQGPGLSKEIDYSFDLVDVE